MDFKTKLLEVLGEDNSDKIDAINKVIPEFFVTKSRYNDMSTRVKEAESKITELESEIEEGKNAQLTDQEKLQKAIEKAELAEKIALKKSNRADVKEILVSKGLTEKEISKFIDDIVSEDNEKSIKLANALAEIIVGKSEQAKISMKEELLQSMGRPDGDGAGSGELTLEQFNNMTYSQQVELAKTNPTLYQTFTAQQQ